MTHGSEGSSAQRPRGVLSPVSVPQLYNRPSLGRELFHVRIWAFWVKDCPADFKHAELVLACRFVLVFGRVGNSFRPRDGLTSTASDSRGMLPVRCRPPASEGSLPSH